MSKANLRRLAESMFCGFWSFGRVSGIRSYVHQDRASNLFRTNIVASALDGLPQRKNALLAHFWKPGHHQCQLRYL
jgi:hypothetical protein